MAHPVYPFRAVLRELRLDAGLTILAAAEATQYVKYERWESGQTRVGGQYLRVIADAFGIADDLHLLVYAWALDSLTPEPPDPVRRLTLEELQHHVRFAPETEVDLGEFMALVVEPGRHIDVALASLAARYHRGGLVELPALDRAALPARESDHSVLAQLYGDVVSDNMAAIGRALLTRGFGPSPSDIAVANIAPALAEPDTFRALADLAEDVGSSGVEQPIARFTASVAPDARRFAQIVEGSHDYVRDLLTAAGRPATDDDVDHTLEQVMAGKKLPLLRLLARAAIRGRIPEIDPAVIDELRSMLERTRSEWRNAAEQQAVIELQRASTDEVFDTLEVLRRRRSA